MSVDVELLVTFSCSEYDGVAALARRYLAGIRPLAEERQCQEAVVFLEEMAARRGAMDAGPRNGVAAWTYGGNYTRPDVFVAVLQPFWDDLLRHPESGGPLRFAHVLVLYQHQDDEHASCIEVYLDTGGTIPADEAGWLAAPLVVRSHSDLPFGW